MSAGLDCSPSAWSAAGWDLHTDEPGSGSHVLRAVMGAGVVETEMSSEGLPFYERANSGMSEEEEHEERDDEEDEWPESESEAGDSDEEVLRGYNESIKHLERTVIGSQPLSDPATLFAQPGLVVGTSVRMCS
jgi:hypothetical protein